jgi:hypothetical protein
MNKIGIGIIDVYGQIELNNCFNSIPEQLKENVYIVSNTNNKLPIKGERFDREVSFAALKNRLIAYFRLLEKKFLFLINSNYAITDVDFFDNTLKKASNFGVWMMTGPGSDTLVVDDEEKQLSLEITPELNADVIFLYSNLIKRYGYFNEHFYSNNQLDTLDYILRLRKDGIYPPNHFNPCMNQGLYKAVVKLNKVNTTEQRSAELSFGLFYNKHQYIPGQNDPVGVSANQMFLAMEEIQKKYAREL